MKRVRIPRLLSSCIIVISLCTAAYTTPGESKLEHEESSRLEKLDSAEIKSEHLETLIRSLDNNGAENEQKGLTLIPKLFGYFRNGLTFLKSPDTEMQSSTPKSDLEEYEDLDEELNFGEEELDEDEIEVGVEDNLPISQGREFENGNVTSGKREMSVYLFQGQYLAEPRLNRFVDGAMENLGHEMKKSDLDPIYFKVMPKGRVLERPKPLRRFPTKIRRRRRRRPARRKVQRRRQKPLLQALFHGRNLNLGSSDDLHPWRQRRQIFGGKKKKPGQANRKRRKSNKIRAVGAGRVEGMSNVLRDGDAEMQLFGNYTLIRSHYNMGPIYLVMQFMTVRGLRRADSTLEKVKIHTVTRVNTQGCEMIDFLLDRPHAVTIEIRNQLFPMATRVAKNIFSRLFHSESFLVARIREKTSLALLSKKTSF